MSRLTTLSATLMILAGSVTSSLAVEDKKPTSAAHCMGMLYALSGEIESGKIHPDTVTAIKPKAKKMAGHCQSEKFDDAFKLYGEITKQMGLKQ